MSDRRDVAVLVGSLRKGSLTRMVARELVALAPESLACAIVEIRDLPLYDAEGRLVNEKTREFLRRFMAAYARWVETVLAGRA